MRPVSAGRHAADRTDAHHAVRRAARERLTAAQRGDARQAALDAAAALGIVAVHECAGPEIGGLDDWHELRTHRHGVEVIGYWGEAVGTVAQARELIAATQARGLAGDLFVDGALGSRTAWLHEPYTDVPADCPAPTGNSYLDADAVAAHLSACTEAGITAGFHVIGDAAVAAVVDGAGDGGASGSASRRWPAAGTASSTSRWSPPSRPTGSAPGVSSPACSRTSTRCGAARTACTPSASASSVPRGLNPFALLASRGVPLAFGSDTPVTDMNPWATVRAATTHHTPGSAVSARAAFAAATRGAWRASGVRDGVTGTLVPGAPATYAVWEADGFDVSAPADAVQRWSTDPRSRVPVLPRLDGDLPRCRQTVHRGHVLHG